MTLNKFPWVFTLFAVLAAFMYFKLGPEKPFLICLFTTFTVREGLTIDRWKSLTYSSAYFALIAGFFMSMMVLAEPTILNTLNLNTTDGLFAFMLIVANVIRYTRQSLDWIQIRRSSVNNSAQ